MADININLGIFAVAAGTVDAITATYTPAPASLYNGLVLFFRASGANTSTTPTFKPNTLAAKTIVKKGNQALVAGDIVGDHALIFNSSNDKWELLNPASDEADTYWQAGAGTNSLKDKRSAENTGNNGFVAGNGAANVGEDGQAIGSSAGNEGVSGQAIGYGAQNTGVAGQAVGSDAQNTADSGQAIGASSRNSADSGQAIGVGAQNSAVNGQAFGEAANNSGLEGQAIGHEAVNAFAHSTALGHQSVSTADDQMNLAQTLRLQAYTGAGTKLATIDNDGIVGTTDNLFSTKTDKLLTINSQSDSYTLVLGDADKLIEMTKATANTLTIPANASVAFPIGTQILLYQKGAGQVTVAITSDSLRSSGSKTKLTGQYASASLIKIASTEWLLSGDITT